MSPTGPESNVHSAAVAAAESKATEAAHAMLADPHTVAAMAAAEAAAAAAAVAASGVDFADAVSGEMHAAHVETKKRRTRSEAAAAAAAATGMHLDDPTTAAAVAASVAAAENDDDFSEDEHDEAMDAVMDKMKEANDAMLHSTATPSGQLVGEQRVQLYDSKRMSRVSFNTWYEFDAYFEMYMQETFQPFRMRSSCSVEAYRRNQQKVMMSNKNSRGRRIEFPDEAVHHHRIYMCTHAMKARCRGAKTRPGQKYRGIGCIAKINVKISPSDNPSKYMVIVTDQVVTHNHPISKEIYESYPDVLLKTMRRNQMTTALLTRQPAPPKFELPSQNQKYERATAVLNSIAELMARLGDEEFDRHLNTLHKFYASIVTDNAQV